MFEHNNLDKKAWLRIIEAFIAIMMVTGTVFLILGRQAASSSYQADQTQQMEKYILEKVSYSTILRNQVLADDLSGVNRLLNDTIPSGYSYYAKICTPDESCSLKMLVSGVDVYVEETVIASNLTYYDPKNIKILKIFVWPGEWPEEACPSDCWGEESSLVCLGNTIVNSSCTQDAENCYILNTTIIQTCSSTEYCDPNTVTCKKKIAVLDTSFSTTSDFWTSGNVKYINWTFTITTANADWFADGVIDCWKIKPSDPVQGFTSNCKTTPYTDSTRNATMSTPFTRNPTASIYAPEASGNVFNRTYFGHDANGNSVNTSTFIIIPFS